MQLETLLTLKDQQQRPKVVCLCGSTRFVQAFQDAMLSETLSGKIVLSVGCNTKSDDDLVKAAGVALDKTVTGHTSWPQNGPFDANLAHLIPCNTAFLCKDTTHKTPQSAEPFASWLR